MATLALTLAVAAPARAQLPSGFTAKDIGDPGAVGSTRVENGVWTIQGSGADIWDSADSFHFAYTEVKGDGSISARILGTDGGDPSWVKAGLMIRENDTPGARNVMLEMTTGNGIEWQWRQEADEPSAN